MEEERVTLSAAEQRRVLVLNHLEKGAVTAGEPAQLLGVQCVRRPLAPVPVGQCPSPFSRVLRPKPLHRRSVLDSWGNRLPSQSDLRLLTSAPCRLTLGPDVVAPSPGSDAGTPLCFRPWGQLTTPHPQRGPRTKLSWMLPVDSVSEGF